MLQWGRNFIVAEISHSSDVMEGGNLASMGPQLYRCGNLRTLFRISRKCMRFNGAATLSLRKSGPCSHISRRFACFNGAATLSLRKCGNPRHHEYRWYLLQWDRNFIVAEMAVMARRIRRGIRASMGPQLYRCGNILHPLHYLRPLSMLQWGRNFIVAEILELGGDYLDVGKLQWGRNFIVAEMSMDTKSKMRLVHASMGPQLYRCGNPYKIPRTRCLTSASMGPQLYRCGNLVWGCLCRSACVASMGPQLYRCGNFPPLPIFLSLRRFNGAATLSLRKSILEMEDAITLLMLQWGRNFIVAEIR